MTTTFINKSERYGDAVKVTIEDYRELNPGGEFEERWNGIYELVNDQWTRIAEVAEEEIEDEESNDYNDHDIIAQAYWVEGYITYEELKEASGVAHNNEAEMINQLYYHRKDEMQKLLTLIEGRKQAGNRIAKPDYTDREA